eukprot:jgi/Chrzof1/10874/Cz05g15170.t1
MQEPVPHIQAHPTPSNLLEWHFVLEGAKATDFAGGLYHGKLVFPPTYPFKPPSISIFTPNGRFATNTKLCLSITDYHPESWNPMWSVGTILTGLLSFMYDNQPTTGSITTSKGEKERLARESLAFNVKNPTFRKLFPEWVEEQQKRLQQAAEAAANNQEQQGQTGTAASSQHDAARAPAPHGSPLLTVAMIIVVLAIAVVPLFSTDTSVNLAMLSQRFSKMGDR